jgi:hypothetical protein
MRRLGVDGHILTGKYQGSRVWLVNVITRAAARDPDTAYVVYSFDPVAAQALVGGRNIEHRALPFRAAIPRLLLYWPYAMLAHRLDGLLTQYIAPPFTARPQIVVVHDVLFETNPNFFPLAMRWRLRLLVRISVARAFAVIAPSIYTRDQIAATYRIPPNRIRQPVLRRLADEPRAVHFGRVDEKTLWAFGIPVLEALAARCPVIAANAAALPEVGGNLTTYFDPLASNAAGQLTECIAKAFLGLLHVDAAAIETHLAQFAWSDAAEALVRIVKIVPKR